MRGDTPVQQQDEGDELKQSDEMESTVRTLFNSHTGASVIAAQGVPILP